MKIFYQWEPGSYSHLAARNIQNYLSHDISEIKWELDFDTVWEQVSEGNIGVLPLENSYAGTIHQNVYNFLLYDHKIIGEYDFEVEHCLLSLEEDVNAVQEVYSHPQALSQTHKYTHKNKWLVKPYGDTAGAAKMISEKNRRWAAAIASELAGEIYKLNILARNIQDQEWNTTKFIVIVPDNLVDTIRFSSQKQRVSIFFEAEHAVGSLFQCLGVFANRGINLTKIESIPLRNQRFSYGFWIRFEWSLSQDRVQEALSELRAIANDIRILGEY